MSLTAADIRFQAAEPADGGRGAQTLAEVVDAAERRAIESALSRSGGDLARVAKELGVSSTTLWRKMKRLGLGRSDSP